jgi:hypothetical protein
MAQRSARVHRRIVSVGLTPVVLLAQLAGCTFDPTLPALPYVDVPVVICDRRASATCSVSERNELAWIAYFGDAETLDTSIGAPATAGQPIAGGGCQFDGVLSIPAIVSSGRLLALDEDDWVTDCRPGADLFSWEDGRTVILGTAVFHRGEQGCVIRTSGFCS